MQDEKIAALYWERNESAINEFLRGVSVDARNTFIGRYYFMDALHLLDEEMVFEVDALRREKQFRIKKTERNWKKWGILAVGIRRKRSRSFLRGQWLQPRIYAVHEAGGWSRVHLHQCQWTCTGKGR